MKNNAREEKTALIEPAIEKLAEQAGNKYILCNVVSKRAKEILKAEQENELKQSNNKKEITLAAEELKNEELVVEYAKPKFVDEEI